MGYYLKVARKHGLILQLMSLVILGPVDHLRTNVLVSHLTANAYLSEQS